MAEKVWLSRPLIGPGPKLGMIASRERISLGLKELLIKNFPGGRFDIFLDAYLVRRLRRLSINIV
jgi:hypothetical protein